MTTHSPVPSLKQFLIGGHAHATFEQVVEGVPVEDRGRLAEGLPYSLWQLIEHIRLAQSDILEFSLSSKYKEKNWPKDFWPASAEPPSEKSWDESIAGVIRDRSAFIDLLESRSEQLYKPFPWGTNQTLLREALLIIDHMSCHIGEIIAVRRVLGNWKR